MDLNPGAGAPMMPDDRENCGKAGTWLDPANLAPIPTDQLMKSVAQRRIVLLGESHNDPEHHRWQLHVLAGLFALHPRLVLGFEMFPRSVQPALDDWTAGRLTATEFLDASRWQEVWGYDPDFYLPLLHFARQNRLPMVALNVDRALVSRVRREGWDRVPVQARQGVSDPAPASGAYRRSLAEVYLAEQSHSGVGRDAVPPGQSATGAAGDLADLAAVQSTAGYRRFVEAQLTWDRAMAEALLDAAGHHPDAMVVGILGRGHIEHGYGVPHQLADLGEDGAEILLPVDGDTACELLAPDIADAVFLLAARDAEQKVPARPRLGVALEAGKGGVQILQVMPGSVAADAGLQTGDIITSAAGVDVANPSDLIEIVGHQAPGTWLPIEVKRGDRTHRLVAKFPNRFE